MAFFVDDRAKHVKEAESAGVPAYQFIDGMPSSSICPESNHIRSWYHLQQVAREYHSNSLLS